MDKNFTFTVSKTIFLILVENLVALAFSGCAWLDAKQRQAIYRPTAGISADFSGLHVGDMRFFVDVPQPGAQHLEMWWLPQADPTAPTLLYFHGTFRTLHDNLHKMEALREAGFSVLALEYRGWGMSSPLIPSEISILQDADVAWAVLQRREPRPAQRVIYGHSMGAGVAVDLASRLQAKTDYGALVLESAFSSFSDLADEAGLLPRLIFTLSKERFDSIEKIKRVNAPVLMIHGNLDSTVPIALSQTLFAAANPPKEWFALVGGHHSDLDLVDPLQYQSLLKAFKSRYMSASQSLN